MPWIDDAKEKQRIIRDILESLPDWFGIQESIEEYVRDGAVLPCFAHYVDGRAVGFVCVKATSPFALEVHVMGVRQDAHRHGIGRMLIEEAQGYAEAADMQILHVKTVAEEAQYASYLKTLAFYRSMGFLPLEVLPLWDEANPCQLLVKWLG